MNSDPAEIERHLRRWNAAARLDARLGGGNRNHVWATRLSERRLVPRLTRRDAPSVRWEIALLAYLQRHDFRVPAVVPASSGEPLVDGLAVLTWLEGEPPRTDEDWWRLLHTLRRLHAVTVGWPQRPGFRSTRDLLVDSSGGDVRLDAMPVDARQMIRAAWRAIANEPLSVVHGDPGAGERPPASR